MKNKIKILILSIALPLLAGGVSGLLIKKNISLYKHLILPPFSPPSFIFPIVWSTLYLLMGISYYFIKINGITSKSEPSKIYFYQLLLNFLWPILFFNIRNFLFSFIVLIALVYLIIKMIISFKEIKPIAGYLQIPYLIWSVFAGYLNFMIFILN